MWRKLPKHYIDAHIRNIVFLGDFKAGTEE